MDLKIIYEDKDLLVADKPAGIDVAELSKMLPENYFLIHRLDKNTSGVILVAKNEEALIFFQKQFTNRDIEKRYLALVVGEVGEEKGRVEALIGRSPKDRTKQKVYLPLEPGAQNQRKAITDYKVIEKFEKYTLLEVYPKSGRKHQIRVHMAHIHHPVAGDEMYGFKGQVCPKGLHRQFLHASFLKVKMPNGEIKEFKSELPENLKQILLNL